MQLVHVGSCQNYGPFLGTLNNRCRIIIGTPKGTIILTTTHVLALLLNDDHEGDGVDLRPRRPQSPALWNGKDAEADETRRMAMLL